MITSRSDYTAPDHPLSAGAGILSAAFAICLHEPKQDRSKRIGIFLLEYRLYDKRSAFNVVGRCFFQRTFVYMILIQIRQLLFLHSFPLSVNIQSECDRGNTDGCWHSSTGVSPRPMLMGAAHNALWAFNARVSLTLSMRRRPQAATLVLRPGSDRSPV